MIVLKDNRASNAEPVVTYADEVEATLPAGNAGELHSMQVPIQQLLPLGSVYSVDFSDATIDVAILRRDNSTPGVLDVYMYYFANIAGGTVTVHFVGTRHRTIS
jgi:hypothetical protein